MANILAIDTSTEWCSVALSLDGNDPILRHEQVSAGASQLILPWVEALIAESQITMKDLDAIAVGVGPGAFTGVRLAVAVTQGLAVANNLPILPIVTLDAIAAQLVLAGQFIEQDPKEFVVAIDARMDEIYWAKYQSPSSTDQLPTRLGNIHLCKPEDINLQDISYLAGSALAAYGNRLFANTTFSFSESCLDHQIQINAIGILRCAKRMLIEGRQCHVTELEPLYVRDKVALTTIERQVKKS